MCKYTYIRLHSNLSVKYVKFLSLFQASICTQGMALWNELVTSLEDQLVDRPGCDLSSNEACCPFKGRMQFCIYNANKLAKFHLKLFQICEAKSCYICAFDIYTGKDQTRCTQTAQVLDPNYNNNKTCCGAYGLSTAFGQRALCACGQFLYKTRTLWGTSLHSKYTCGTVHSNRKGLPKALIAAKLKKIETVFRWSGPLLAIKWCDKRAITVLTTVHPAVHVETNKTDAEGIEF